jgi:mono/diheme cytochrome c family protein
MTMSVRNRIHLALAALAAFTAMAVSAQPRADLGQREYKQNCASCHGLDGRGGGPFVEFLKRSPPDLTQLAKANKGVFPVLRAYEVIDGKGHGSRDMPVWGAAYAVRASEYYVDMPYDQEAFVRGRILALIEYLDRLQQK